MYLKKTIIYGNRIEIIKYHSSRYGVIGEKRAKRSKPSAETVAKNNERLCIKKLTRLMIANFDEGDCFLTLTYRPDVRPDAEGAKKALRKFLDGLRAEYRKAGTELKYIAVTEWRKKSIHHHIVINDAPGLSRMITKHWKAGGIHTTPLFPDQDYQGLAEYLTKETRETFRDKDNPYRQRYTCSRNLKKPEEHTEVVKAGSWRQQPTVPAALKKRGYRLDIDSVSYGIDVFGYPYMAYTMIRS